MARAPGRWTTGRDRPDQQARGEHDDARGDRDGGRPASLRADATGVKACAASGGDPVRRPGGLVAARPAAVDRQLLRARPTPGPRRRPVRDRRGRSRRPARRRRRRRVLPRRDRRVRVRRGASLHRGRSCTPRRARGRGDAQRPGARRHRAALRPALGLDALRRRRSPRAAEPRSPRWATRSTKRHASRRARPADSRSLPRRWSNAWNPTTPPRSTSTPTASPTHRSQTSAPPPRKPAATHRPSPSAKSEASATSYGMAARVPASARAIWNGAGDSIRRVRLRASRLSGRRDRSGSRVLAVVVVQPGRTVGRSADQGIPRAAGVVLPPHPVRPAGCRSFRSGAAQRRANARGVDGRHASRVGRRRCTRTRWCSATATVGSSRSCSPRRSRSGPPRSSGSTLATDCARTVTTRVGSTTVSSLPHGVPHRMGDRLGDADLASQRVRRPASRVRTRRIGPASRGAMSRPNIDSATSACILGDVRVPTLVLHRKDDRLPVGAARRYSPRTSRSRLRGVAGVDASLLVGVHGGDARRGRGVRHRRPVGPAGDRVLATVLFTDIVGSTARRRSSVTQVARTARTARATSCRAARAFGGREVNTGATSSSPFDGPARAIRCALAVAATPASSGSRSAAGLHTGEVRLEGEIGGITVHIGARVAPSRARARCSSRARSWIWSPALGSPSRTGRARAQGRSRRVEALRRHGRTVRRAVPRRHGRLSILRTRGRLST